MTKALSTFARELFAGGDLQWDANNFSMVLLDATYTYNVAHNALDDVGGGSRVTTFALAGKTVTNGWCDATDPVFTAVSGSTITQLWIFLETGGAESTKTLVYYTNEDSVGSPISVVPNGSDINGTVPALGFFQV